MSVHTPLAPTAGLPTATEWTGREGLLARTILISGLSREASEASLRTFFTNLGRIESLLYSPAGDAPLLPIGHASIVFSQPEEAASALRLNGCSIWGPGMEIKLASNTIGSSPLTKLDPHAGQRTTPMSVPRMRQPAAPEANLPHHKNLYVLNLPLDATTDQLAALFSGYGSVVHCVILAMLDAQARRRGFIDMSASNEAKAAIESLNGFVWKGYPIEVSYAIVQRSGGPFDHTQARNVIKRNVPRNRFNTGPRRVPNETMQPAYSLPYGAYNDGGPPSGMVAGMHHESNSNNGGNHHGSDIKSLANDPCTLLISGLDPVAVLDDDDLRLSLEPYGRVNAVSLSRDERGVSRGFGIVTFNSEAEAMRARAALDGKIINGRRISARNLEMNRMWNGSAAGGAAPALLQGSVGLPTPAAFAQHGSYYAGPQCISWDDRYAAAPARGGMDQGPMGAIGSGQMNHNWPPAPSAPHTPAPSIRPELYRMHSAPYANGHGGRGSLGEPFEQQKASDGEQLLAHGPQQHGGSGGGGGDWRHRHSTSGSFGQNSPASTFSMSTLSSTSELQTPDSAVSAHHHASAAAPNGADPIWTVPRRALGSPSWGSLRGLPQLEMLGDQQQRKDVAVDGNLSELRRDSPPFKAGNVDPAARRPAPVGHEKSSSSPTRPAHGSDDLTVNMAKLRVGGAK